MIYLFVWLYKSQAFSFSLRCFSMMNTLSIASSWIKCPVHLVFHSINLKYLKYEFIKNKFTVFFFLIGWPNHHVSPLKSLDFFCPDKINIEYHILCLHIIFFPIKNQFLWRNIEFATLKDLLIKCLVKVSFQPIFFQTLLKISF